MRYQPAEYCIAAPSKQIAKSRISLTSDQSDANLSCKLASKRTLNSVPSPSGFGKMRDRVRLIDSDTEAYYKGVAEDRLYRSSHTRWS